ncbi:potassium-transporting ATPase subunit KdpB [Calothrix rhizosoleniae]|uniref:potassium-transporting ATPase subunit KdpB n=1 Tax=Calothrix rhizosoleniae TaxID=888997 RepID=UPI000B498CA0|nr:potassium-transporting ATPase subunit KdpB [Calothrix rhizosoleniae]
MKQSKHPTQDIYSQAIVDAFFQLNPQSAIQNPVILLVWLGTILTLILTIAPNLFGEIPSQNPRLFNGLVTFILLVTIYAGNLGEVIAKAKGQAKANKLRSLKSETIAKKLAVDGTVTEVSSQTLQRGDSVYVVAGDIIPADGEVILGVGSVDESIITGESAPILKESGSEVASSVTEGTRIISDELIISVTANPGQGFIDRMIASMSGEESRKIPNEIALQALLAVMALIFLFVVVTLPAFAFYLQLPISATILVALLVSLMPTTIASLLKTISIAGIDRIANSNVIANSLDAEICTDVNTLVIDKTGTITLGNRLAENFIPINGHSELEVAAIAIAASVFDDTPEGKSIIRLADKLGAKIDFDPYRAEAIYFSTTTRISGTNLPNGSQVRKGALAAIKEFVGSSSQKLSDEIDLACERISLQGGTPLAVCLDGEIYGVIHLKDIVKPGIRDRFYQLQRLGIYTIMVTGDNKTTAGVISREAGIDDFIAEATPADKITVIQQQQAEGKLVAMTGEGNNDAPALAQANIGLAMNTGTQAAKSAANMVDLDSDPTKLIDIITIGKQLLMTRGVLTTFSISNDIAKYFAILPILFTTLNLGRFNIMQLSSTNSAVLSVLIYNAIAIFAFIPLALRGIKFRPVGANQIFQSHLLIYGIGGAIIPFVAIKLIDMAVTTIGLA